ncbi:MAG: hypothetical protein HY744_15855 [Deltaproteobacteria bacterium]|nr:hypothetical protein [Deltaproteobacteria bacterium]
MSTRARLLVALVAFVALGVSCKKGEALTLGEATQALDEAAMSTQASSAVGATVEITTNFTIGQAVEEAAKKLLEFYQTQLPCAEVVLDQNTLKVTYGAKGNGCAFQGQTFTGSHTATVTKNEENDVVVDHVWDKLSNGKVEVSGTAHVTWSLQDKSRHVVHELHWKRLRDGREATGSGDRLQTVLPGGLGEGIQIDGTRDWKGQAGDWHLDIAGVQVRWKDPVPQAGTYTLDTPFDKTATLSFARLDEDTIEVTFETGEKQFKFKVTSTGDIASEQAE